jgi:putative FmdB family regulatory protein
MPLYEYRCRKCDARFERLEKASEPTDRSCPECGGVARRLIGAPALQFKGSGWYINDYGSGKGPQASDADTSSPSVADASTDKKTDAKTDKKADAKSEKKADLKPEKKTDTKVA